MTVRNDDVRQLTKQPPLSSTFKSRCLSLSRHVARMDEEMDGYSLSPRVLAKTSWTTALHLVQVSLMAWPPLTWDYRVQETQLDLSV